jgi:tRNA threonylcarbamoyl adenosine modification protein YeaZ
MSGVPQVSIVAIDTSGSFCSVALRRADGSVVYRESAGEGDHFERLPELVRDVCLEAGVSPATVGQIRIGTGPGSFTGLRIGMSFAKGLAVAHRIPLVGISSFLAAAHSISRRGEVDGALAVISDARRDEVFMATYAVSARAGCGAWVVEVSPARIVPTDHVVAWQAEQSGRRVYSSIRGFAPRGVLNVAVESRIAEGLLEVEGVDETPFSLDRVSLLEPTYLRAVAAKSIEERRGA